MDEDSYFDGDSSIMKSEFVEDDHPFNSSNDKTPDYAIANVSCHYDGSPGKSQNIIFS